ncbi:MAG: DUF1631 family protein [Candidatus Accumulibacter necessarius]|jgi:hypothetical protein|uniref:DUF1631 family protein n=1 Tax=Candidatus Accumulibacter necessarius TaxID=2954386 RepID=UPI002FC3DEB8
MAVPVPANNVIRFPEGVRGALVDVDHPGVLTEARDLMGCKLRDAFRSVLPRVEEELLSKGDVACGRAQRVLFYHTGEAIHAKAPQLEGALLAKWSALFTQACRASNKGRRGAASSPPQELQLVDFGAMDEELVVKAIAGSLRSQCDEGLFAIGRRLAFLSGEPEGSLPIEHLIAESLGGAFEDAGLVGKAKLEILQLMERHAVDVFGPTIDDLNAFLIGRGVLPQLSRTCSPSPNQPRNATDPGKPAESADLFALLQELVRPPQVSAGTGGASVGSGAGYGPSTGVSMGGASPAGMAVAMEQVMASLDTLQRAVPVQTAAALMDNVLRQFHSSDAGQNLDYLHSVTVDIVATLFDFIFDDASVADPIKALVARMQIPVLKVAMLDKTFFSSKSHPARRLLDGISRAAVRCGPQAGHDNPLYARVAEIVERLQNEFSQDTELFDTLCIELEAFLESQEAAADAHAVNAAPLVAEQERYELAAAAADHALVGWLAMPLPSAVTDLLDNEWRKLLVRHSMDGDNAAWEAAMDTVSELVASVDIPSDVPSRKRLAARLPTLVRRICNGLGRLEMADDRRLALIDALFSVHAAVLRGTAPPIVTPRPVLPVAEPVPVSLAREQVVRGETQIERISLAGANELPPSRDRADVLSLVGSLQRGDWVEFANPESGPLRYRLSWISPQRGILLFTTSQSPRAISVTPNALALQIERGEAILMPPEPMFDRAVNRALQKLKAA